MNQGLDIQKINGVPLATLLVESAVSASLSTEYDVPSTLPEWWHAVVTAGQTARSTAARAALFALNAPSLGHAFMAGYQCALRRLIPDLFPIENIISFCISEADGAHPKAIKSTLTPGQPHWQLAGEKSWSTLAPIADCLIVAAVRPEPLTDGQKDIAMIYLDKNRAGITVNPRPATPFLPNVPHAIIQFESVSVATKRILGGDGYLDYIKPFRTLEDLHVCAAGAGYLLKTGLGMEWSAQILESLIASILLADQLSATDGKDPGTHLALAGYLNHFDGLVGEIQTLLVDNSDPAAKAFMRDAMVFAVAGKARKIRNKRAWEWVDKLS